MDNTFATPLNQQPLDFGATVSLQSATKFIGGHSDLLAGVAITKDDALWHALRKSRELTGATPGTLEAFLAVRGARTLALRVQRAQQTAMTLSERLERHPLVARVRYPVCRRIRRMRLLGECSRASERSFRSICVEGLRLLIVSAGTSGSSAMPPVSERWNQRLNEELRLLDRDTFHRRSYDSALASRTPTISGSISTPQYALLHRDSGYVPTSRTISGHRASRDVGAMFMRVNSKGAHEARPPLPGGALNVVKSSKRRSVTNVAPASRKSSIFLRRIGVGCGRSIVVKSEISG